jgi:hypothetical protein
MENGRATRPENKSVGMGADQEKKKELRNCKTMALIP